MCLENNVKSVYKLLNKAKTQKFIWAYKKLKNYYNGQDGLFSIMYDHKWIKGVNKSNIQRKIPCLKQYEEIEKGIHVYLTHPSNYANVNIVVRVKCELKHLIGASSTQAVFSQVELPETEYCKALGLPYRKRNRRKKASVFD